MDLFVLKSPTGFNQPGSGLFLKHYQKVHGSDNLPPCLNQATCAALHHRTISCMCSCWARPLQPFVTRPRVSTGLPNRSLAQHSHIGYLKKGRLLAVRFSLPLVFFRTSLSALRFYLSAHHGRETVATSSHSRHPAVQGYEG